MHDERLTARKLEPQILSATVGGDDALSDQPGGQIGGTRLVAADGAGMVYSHSDDRSARDVSIESAPDSLDFGKFGH
jgi:hypothetical protein